MLCLIVATHNHTTQFERWPNSISSYLINPGLIKWIQAVKNSRIEIALYRGQVTREWSKLTGKVSLEMMTKMRECAEAGSSRYVRKTSACAETIH